MNSIYIESEKIKSRKDIVEWLDKCGATIKHLKNIVENTYIIFGVSKANGIKYWKYNTFLSEAQKEDSTHCQTPEQFCELIAECLGIDKPVFEVDISKTETTTKPIKGMAIEVSRLSEGDREWLDSHWVRMSKWGDFKFLQWYEGEESLFCDKVEYTTITDSPTEFLRYVAQQTGKEYKPGIASEKEIAEMLEKMSEDCFTPPSYPHKTYRILDSLDGIPLDTRIPLSEWIPPFGKEVLWIFGDEYVKGVWHNHNANGLIIRIGESKFQTIKDLDGHWMRIV